VKRSNGVTLGFPRVQRSARMRLSASPGTTEGGPI